MINATFQEKISLVMRLLIHINQICDGAAVIHSMVSCTGRAATIFYRQKSHADGQRAISKAYARKPRIIERHHVMPMSVSTAAEKCARWRRNSVPVGLIKKGLEALLIDPRCEPREA
jgi:hypothetical protein